MGTQQHKFVALDGMRGIAALTVMSLHYRDYFFYGFPSATWIVPNGGTAVDLFFALSGFVLAHAYENRFKAGLGTARFMALRFVRIYPLYLLGASLAVLVSIAGWHGSYAATQFLYKMGEYAGGLLFIPWVCSGCRFFPLNFPAWSLLIELIANLAYRIFFRFLSVWVLGLVAVVSFVGVAFTCEAENDLGVGSLVADLFRVGFSFPAGVLLYRLWIAGHRHIKVSSILPILGMIALFFLPIQYFAFLATLLVFPILVYLGACAEPRGLLGKIQSELGTASFAVYMLHIPVLETYKILSPDVSHLSGSARLIAYVALMVFVFVGAVFFDRVYDAPIRRFLNRVVTRQSGWSFTLFTANR